MIVAHNRVNYFTVTSEQIVSADSIREIIANTLNKVMAIKEIRDQYRPINLRDAKEIYEAVIDETFPN
jgi:hypothetical protein